MTKYTKQQQSVLDFLRQLEPSNEIGAYTFRNEVVGILEQKQREYNTSAAAHQRARVAMEAMQARSERTARLGQARGAWAKKNLKVGDLIKVSGTRDGSGLREVLELQEHNIVARQLRAGGKSEQPAFKVYVSSSKRIVHLVHREQITTHGYDKVMARGKPLADDATLTALVKISV